MRLLRHLTTKPMFQVRWCNPLLFAMLVPAGFLLASCSGQDVPPTEAAEDARPAEADPAPLEPGGEIAIEEIASKLRECPDWSYARDDRTRQRILELLDGIRKYPLDRIRQAVQKIISEDPLGNQQDKLFLLNAYLFDLPERLPPKAKYYDGGYFTLEKLEKPQPQSIDAMWPLSYGPEGEVRLTGKAFASSGPPYPALEAFDYYRKTYGPRTFPAQHAKTAEER